MSDIKLERRIVWLAALIQLANVLDFMIILPLGPDLTKAIDIPSSQMGLVGGIYTFAAAFSAMMFSKVLDRFDRKKAVLFFLTGLVISTFITAFVWDSYSLLAARVLAGMFGGPVTALSLSMVIDMVPMARRGRSMALVTSAFTVAAVFGIPIGLELALYSNWQMPFYVISFFGAVVCLGVVVLLPSMTGHMATHHDQKSISIFSMLKRSEIMLSYILFSLSSFASFLIIPCTIIYFTFNLGFPREGLSNLYIVGGIISFAAMQISGRIVDLYGARILSFMTAIFYVIILSDGFLHLPHLDILWIFSFFMMCSAMMSVIITTIASEAPKIHERAAFMSLQTTFRHLAAGAGAIISSMILTSDEMGRLDNIEYVIGIAIACILSIPVIVIILRKALNAKASKESTLLADQ